MEFILKGKIVIGQTTLFIKSITLLTKAIKHIFFVRGVPNAMLGENSYQGTIERETEEIELKDQGPYWSLLRQLRKGIIAEETTEMILVINGRPTINSLWD